MNAVVRGSRVKALYEGLTDESPHGKVGWSSREVQFARHEQIAALIPAGTKTILDVGCGLGDLMKVIPTNLEYMGIDFNSAFIAEAETRYPGQHFFHSDVLDWRHPADVVIASGLLAGYDSSDTVHITRHLFGLANNGFIFNYFERGASEPALHGWAKALSSVIAPTSPTIVTNYTPGDVTIMLSHA